MEDEAGAAGVRLKSAARRLIAPYQEQETETQLD
jgi:hypothetical protein